MDPLTLITSTKNNLEAAYTIAKLFNDTNKGANYTGYTGSATTLSALVSTITLDDGEVIALWNTTTYSWNMYIVGFWEPTVTVPKNSVIFTKVEDPKISPEVWTIPGEEAS